jgi:hypothetical protein
MRRRGALAIALTVLAACTNSQPDTTTGPSPPRGQHPARVGGRTYCNLLAPIQATGRFYYPPLYPSGFLPQPERCFASVADARAAGLGVAPPPPGSRVISGIYLVQTGLRMARTCKRSARRLGFPVACPGLAPDPAETLRRVPQTGGQFWLAEMFAASTSYKGSGEVGRGPSRRSIGHLLVESVRHLRLGGFCTEARFLFSIEIGRRHARYLNCPEGSETHSGHVLLVWRQAGAAHLVSLHGRTSLNRRIEFVLVDHSRIVQPSRHEQPWSDSHPGQGEPALLRLSMCRKSAEETKQSRTMKATGLQRGAERGASANRHTRCS